MAAAGTQDLIQFLLVEAGKLRNLAASIFAIDLDKAGNEELLFFVRLCLPVVLLAKRDNEADFSSPFLPILVNLRASKRVNLGEVVEVPRLADRKGSVWILLGLVHSNPARLSDSDNYDTWFLRVGRAALWRWR